MLWGRGLEKQVYADVCYQRTRWNCAQWATDGSLLLIVTPLTLTRGAVHGAIVALYHDRTGFLIQALKRSRDAGWTAPILGLLAATMSAKLALIGCYSRSIAPIAFQTFFTFWVALATIWLSCWRRERQLINALKQGLVVAPHATCTEWVGNSGRCSGWGDGWLRLTVLGAVSVTFCNFLLMLFKLWLDEPSTFEKFADGSGSGANSYNRHKVLPLDPDTGDDTVFSREGNLRLVELLMGGPGLTLSAKLFDNGKVFGAAMLLTSFSVIQAKFAAHYCAPSEHLLAALLICPPGIPQVLGCTKARQFQEL